MPPRLSYVQKDFRSGVDVLNRLARISCAMLAYSMLSCWEQCEWPQLLNSLTNMTNLTLHHSVLGLGHCPGKLDQSKPSHQI